MITQAPTLPDPLLSPDPDLTVSLYHPLGFLGTICTTICTPAGAGADSSQGPQLHLPDGEAVVPAIRAPRNQVEGSAVPGSRQPAAPDDAEVLNVERRSVGQRYSGDRASSPSPSGTSFHRRGIIHHDPAQSPVGSWNTLHRRAIATAGPLVCQAGPVELEVRERRSELDECPWVPAAGAGHEG
ncbi:hypothetical protein DL770_009655 [Monosporascus sp. CRB-9-2]|nr:hypothetical protein DL770_009655 [Monosporascus sp. CRB-9-2]